MYQGLVKWFLGIRKEGECLVINPASPSTFGDHKVYFRCGNSEYEIKIERATGGKLVEMELTVDGIRMEGNRIKLENDDRVHQANVIF